MSRDVVVSTVANAVFYMLNARALIVLWHWMCKEEEGWLMPPPLGVAASIARSDQGERDRRRAARSTPT